MAQSPLHVITAAQVGISSVLLDVATPVIGSATVNVSAWSHYQVNLSLVAVGANPLPVGVSLVAIGSVFGMTPAPVLFNGTLVKINDLAAWLSNWGRSGPASITATWGRGVSNLAVVGGDAALYATQRTRNLDFQVSILAPFPTGNEQARVTVTITGE